MKGEKMNVKPTPGPWKWHCHSDKCAANVNRDGRRIASVSDCGGGKSVAEANAALIAEAGTVATETGLTPRQLAEQRAELLEFVKWIAGCSAQHYAMSVYPGENKIVPVHNRSGGDHFVSAEHFTAIVEQARAAISKSERRDA